MFNIGNIYKIYLQIVQIGGVSIVIFVFQEGKKHPLSQLSRIRPPPLKSWLQDDPFSFCGGQVTGSFEISSSELLNYIGVYTQ